MHEAKIPAAPDLLGDVAKLARVVQQELPCEGTPWRVCVRGADGPASAAFTLQSYEQVLLFEQGLEALGYEMLMLDERFRHCDFARMARVGVRSAAY